MAKNTLTDRIKNPDGKPILKLTPLKRTLVNAKTKKKYDELMRVYELGNWKWGNGDLPTNPNGYGGVRQIYVETINKFLYTRENYFLKEDYNIISQQKFYKIQKITPKMLKEINKYFEEKK